VLGLRERCIVLGLRERCIEPKPPAAGLEREI